jgi:hypothetical protein
VKPKIPLDVDHNPDDSVGYLNKFDTSSGQLECDGVIVIADPDTQALYDKMASGVPYEASIEHRLDDDTLLEYVPEGYTTTINATSDNGPETVQGPVTIVRQWALKSVAITKFGADDATSANLLMSEKTKKDSGQKGFFFHLSNHKTGELSMSNKVNDKATEVATAVEAKVEAVKAVEADAKVEPVKLNEVSVKADKAVEAEKIEDSKKDEIAVPAVAEAVALSAKEVDPRSEFKRFVATFGNERASIYFAEGLDFTVALTKFASDVQAENAELQQRLKAVDRGAESPIRFAKVDAEAAKGSRKPVELNDKKQGLASVVRMPK